MTPTELMTIALRRAGIRTPGTAETDIARTYLNIIKTEVETAADWRFLYLVTTLTTVAAQRAYDLAADVLVPLHFWDTTNNMPILIRHPDEITDLDADENLTGNALLVAIKGRDTTTGYWEVDLLPTPSAASQTLKYRYRSFIATFTAAMDETDMAPKYPGWFQNALLWGVCALVKEEKENASATVEWEKYSASLKFGMDLNKAQGAPPRIMMGQGGERHPFTFQATIIPDEE